MLEKRAPFLSIEGRITLVVGLIAWLVPEVPWWFRGLGVFGTSVLAIHTAKQTDRLFLKLVFPVGVIGILVAGTWQSIWRGFQDAFPAVNDQEVLSTIIEFCAVAGSGIAGWYFLLRPRAKGGYKVLPAQVMAFGFCVTAFGLITAGIGLAWQFQQNWIGGTKPSGAPAFKIGSPQITRSAPPIALPPPSQHPEEGNPYFLNYSFTDAGVAALADELFKAKDALGHSIELDRMSTDESSAQLDNTFSRACDQAGIDCHTGIVHPNSPEEKGLIIYVADPNKPPPAAQELRTIFKRMGLDVPLVARPGFGPPSFSLFIGPRPG